MPLVVRQVMVVQLELQVQLGLQLLQSVLQVLQVL